MVTAVLTTATYLEVRLFERAVELELRRTAERAAHAVVDDLERAWGDFDPVTFGTPQRLIEANPALHSLSIFDTDARW